MKPSAVTLLLLALLAAPIATAQDVIRYDGSGDDLSSRWQWAQSQLDDVERGSWIGWSIQRLMHENSHIGAWSSRQNRQQMSELIYGVRVERPARNGDRDSERQVMKELVLLFQFDGSRNVSDVKFSTLDGEVDIRTGDVIWLGESEKGESLDIIDGLTDRTRGSDVREDMTAAIAMHDNRRAVDMLADMLKNDSNEEVRGQAAFWMSQISYTDLTVGLLIDAAETDRSEEVREQAVFALSQIENEEGTEALIKIAREGDRSIKDEAIFWLGQKASDKAIASLGEIVDEDPDVEVKKQAIFALSQQDNRSGLEKLIEIANSHDSPAVRKEAIFWISQSDDPAALDAIVSLIRG